MSVKFGRPKRKEKLVLIERKRSKEKQAANNKTYTKPIKKGSAKSAFGGRKK